MANRHAQEEELYARIKDENITIHPLVWDTLYLYLGDYISVINFIAGLYVAKNEPVAIEDSRKILAYTMKITEIVDKLLHHEKIGNENERLEKIKNRRMLMHPVVLELVKHYVGNDVSRINFIVSDYLDPIDPKPILIEHAKKILDSSLSMSAFLDKFRKATQKDVGF